MAAPKLILASTSPYRRHLLEKLGLPFEAVAPGVDETPLDGEAPDALALRLAQEKALAVARKFPGSLVVGSDQVAVLDGERLGKPLDRDTAAGQLRRASGRSVAFYTALCAADSAAGESRSGLDRCAVVFRTLTEGQIQRYVDRDRPFDCAGGFKSEGLGIALFERFEGEDPNALVGLPLIRLTRMLEDLGVAVL
jgi:septum formation protein